MRKKKMKCDWCDEEFIPSPEYIEEVKHNPPNAITVCENCKLKISREN